MITVRDFYDHIGIEPVRNAMQAIDKYNVEHVWLILPDGERVYYHDVDRLDTLTPDDEIAGVGVGGIAWDGSDWEWGTEEMFDKPGARPWRWSDLDDMREAFHDALAEHQYENEEE